MCTEKVVEGRDVSAAKKNRVPKKKKEKTSRLLAWVSAADIMNSEKS